MASLSSSLGLYIISSLGTYIKVILSVGSWAQIIQLGFGLKAQAEDKRPSEDG